MSSYQMLEGWGGGRMGGKWDPRGDRNIPYLDCGPGYTRYKTAQN